jgi:hypothetical protein
MTTLTRTRDATLKPESPSARAGSTDAKVTEHRSGEHWSRNAATRDAESLIGAPELGAGGHAQRVGRPVAMVARRLGGYVWCCRRLCSIPG